MPYGNLNDKKGSKLGKLCKMSVKPHCLGIFILNFRDLNETYVINAVILRDLKKNSGRKSLSIKEARLKGVKIPQKLKRVRYSYDFTGIF